MSENLVEKYTHLKPGMKVSVHERIKEVNAKGEEKERIQVFSGMLIARKGKTAPESTITVRKTSNGISVEKVFPLNLPDIDKIDVEKEYQTRQSKLYYLRNYKKNLKEVKTA